MAVRARRGLHVAMAQQALHAMSDAEPAQDAHDRAAARSVRSESALEHPGDLVRAPARMLIAQRENRENDVLTGATRTRIGPPALLDQAKRTKLPIAPQPLCPVCRETPNSSQNAERLLPFCAARSTNCSFKLMVRCSFQGIHLLNTVNDVLTLLCQRCPGTAPASSVGGQSAVLRGDLGYWKRGGMDDGLGFDGGRLRDRLAAPEPEAGEGTEGRR